VTQQTKKPTKRTTPPAIKAKAGLAVGSSGGGVAEVQAYLTRFGYLAPAVPKSAAKAKAADITLIDDRPIATAGSFDDATEVALRNFQSMAGLPTTGTLDAATLAKMSMHRCGNTDARSFVASGGRWANTNLTYAFQEFTADLTQAQTRAAIHQAFSMWSGFTPLTFREGSLATAQIIIRFVTGDHGDGANNAFDGANGILAHAFFPGTPPAAPSAIHGDTHFDDAEVWTLTVPPGASQFDLTTVATHEFGHALGLDHSAVRGSVMEAFYGGPRRYLHADDIQGITSIYGGYSIAEASWIHGTSVQIELPENLESVRRFGFFTRLVGKPNSTNWVHFAIPTPVIQNGVRRTFGPCMLRFSTGGTNAVLRDVHLYDGEVRVAAHDSVNLSGSQPFTRFGIAHAPKILWGAGISLGLRFGTGDAAARTIDLISAGCDFQP
jgi:hypothetical protein